MASAVNQKVVVIGSSTGGIESLNKILPQLPRNFPPVAIVQHMPVGMTKSLSVRLDRICQMEVKEAESGDVLKAGQILIAPSGIHMAITISQDNLVVKCFHAERVNSL